MSRLEEARKKRLAWEAYRDEVIDQLRTDAESMPIEEVKAAIRVFAARPDSSMAICWVDPADSSQSDSDLRSCLVDIWLLELREARDAGLKHASEVGQSLGAFMTEVIVERQRQVEKWGDQPGHPHFTDGAQALIVTASFARDACQSAFAAGGGLMVSHPD